MGGQEVRYAEISKALTAHGHSVHVYCVQNVSGTSAEEIVDGTMVHRYPEAYRYRQPLLRKLRRSPTAVLKYALWCSRIDAVTFDCFVFNQWPLAHVLLAPRRIRDKAVIDWCEYRKGTLIGSFQKYLPRLAAANITNSVALRNAFQSGSGRDFDVLPSGVFTARYRTTPAPERQGILYVGRIEEHKNLELTVSAYDSLLGRGYTGRLRIAGSGPALPALQKIINASRVADNIDLLGAVSEEQKIQLLATSQILLLTSRREGFPRILTEAMASGLPIVSVNYPENGARDIVRQYRIGGVTDPDPGEVAEGVLAVLSDWETYSHACLRASRSLDWGFLIDRLIQIATDLSSRRA